MNDLNLKYHANVSVIKLTGICTALEDFYPIPIIIAEMKLCLDYISLYLLQNDSNNKDVKND